MVGNSFVKLCPQFKIDSILRFAPHIVLTLLILFQSTGLFLTHSLQVSMVRYEMKQRIKAGVPEEQRVVLKITPEVEASEDFEWFHSKEFRFKGEMYDILSREQHGDTTWYTCIHDVKESGLFNRLDSLVKEQLNGDPLQKKQRKLFLGFFQKVYLYAVADILFAPADIHTLHSHYSEFFTTGVLSGLLRPPSA